MPSLTLADARERAACVREVSYDVALDLTLGPEVFASRTTITFAADEGSRTWCDVRARSVERMVLNGIDLDAAHLVGDRLTLPDLAGTNTLVVEATMHYSHDGQGLHRASDPADGRDYVYGHLFLDAAPTVYACFDQPDIKAPYDIRVRVPEDWTVIGNGAARRLAPGEWELATTKPLATYFVTICAGPYVSVLAEHDGIPLGLHARASLREPLERHAADLLEVTRQSFDYFHGLFGIRYPFGEYHQVFVPEFNAGAMENPGCVTFRDQYLFRGAATTDELLSRANTVSHEMAHMWFGDIVTMRWWDDLWLNESFAEYMSHRCLVAATKYTDAWVDSTMVRKVWGYAAERSPSTHPVAGVAALDAQSALQNFDGISYAKGAAVLRQLIAHVGDDAFVQGVRTYLKQHAYGNGDLADFLGAIEGSSGLDLDAWSRAWLLTARRDRIAAELTRDGSAVALTRVPPESDPANRPHTLDVAAWADGDELFRVSGTVTQDDSTLAIDTAGSSLTQASVEQLSRMVLAPNASDLTWARVVLSPETVANLSTQLALVPDGAARSVFWTALLDGVHDATVSPEDFLDTFAHAWPSEELPSILRVASYADQLVVARFVPRPYRPAARTRLAEAGLARLSTAVPGGSPALTAARLVASASQDVELLGRWLRGDDLPSGLEDDGDFRWIVARNLAGAGVIGAPDIDALRERDDTMQGRLNALTCRASLPNEADKEWAWAQLTGRHGRSNYEMVHLAQGFWAAPDDALVEPYVERYFADMPRMSEWVGEDALSRVVLVAYPRVFTPDVARASAECLARTDLTPAVHRSMLDADAALREVLTSMSTYPR